MEHLKYTEILNLNKALAGTVKGKAYRVKVLSNVTINSFKDILEYFFRINNIEPAIELGNYDNIMQDSMNAADKDIVIVMYEMLNITDAVSGYFEDIDEVLYASLLQKLFSEIDIMFDNLRLVPPVIFNTFSSAFFIPDFSQRSKIDGLVRQLNNYVEEKKPKNFSIINIDKVIIQTGVKHAFDQRFYYSSKAPYSLSFFKHYCNALQHIILKNTGRLKKALIFDCDNTLWKGILGEDGADGIDMSPTSKSGREYNLVQQMARYLGKKGVIVGICSKNNPQEVDDVLQSHKDIVLKDDSIVIKKVNWEDKASNLRSIAQQLNIGLDSIVFVDDSPFEVNLIKEQLPEILVLQVPATGYADFLQSNIYTYFNLTSTADDIKKAEMYKQQFEREQAKNTSVSLDHYLSSLQMEIELEENNPAYIPRIAQLTQKTNQFNLTTKRYTESQIGMLMQESTSDVISLSVKDKFGDNGLTGVCILKKDGNNSLVTIIDSLLMSCRIIGRNIEMAFIDHILISLKEEGVQKVTASFVATAKNAQVNSFYEKVGFILTEDANGIKEYSINLAQYLPRGINYINIKKGILKNHSNNFVNQ